MLITSATAYLPPALSVRAWVESEREAMASPRRNWAYHAYKPLFAAYGLDVRQLQEPLEIGLTVEGLSASTGITTIPVEQHLELSELAVKAAQALLDLRRDCGLPDGIDSVIVCHTSLNEQVSTSTASRLRSLVGQECFPFALAQQQGATFVSALGLACDLLHAEPEQRGVLIICAEKWFRPFPRRIGQWTLQGDGASALLVERRGVPGLHILSTAVRRIEQLNAGLGLSAHPDEVNEMFAAAVHELVRSELDRLGLGAHEFRGVVPHRVNRTLVAQVHARLGLPGDAASCDGRAYLGTAETVVNLVQLLQSVHLRAGERLLLWTVGLGGFVGCAMLETHGAMPPVASVPADRHAANRPARRR